jgi:hypothetical protein
MFYLYHTTNGWITPQATYTSDIAQARVWQEAEALARCKRMKAGDRAIVLPIRIEDMESI